MQPDSIIPDLSNPQSWNRYSYVYNSPIIKNDPTGHCPFCIAAVVGGLIGAGVDLYNQYQEGDGSFENVNWGEVAVAGAIGAVAGLVGAALITPGAVAIATATGTGAVGEFVAGSFMAGTANVLLSNTQRVSVDIVRGNNVTTEGIVQDFRDNYPRDMFFGIAGYSLGRIFNSLSKSFMILDDWRVNTTDYRGQPFLNPSDSQKAIMAVTSAGAEALSNSTLLDCTAGRSCKKPPDTKFNPVRRPSSINNILMQ